MADPRLLFPGWPRRRQLLPRHAAGSLRQRPGSTPGPPWLSHRVPPRLRVWIGADGRSRAAGALLAHAGPIRDLRPDTQDVLSDVDRRMGAACLRRVRLSLVRRGARRTWLARLAASSPARPTCVRRA